MNTLKDKAQQRAARIADRDFQRMARMAAQLGAAEDRRTEWLPLTALRLDGGTQPRAKLDERVVTEYAEAMAEGAEFPAVDVFYDGADYWLADGFHRVAAARKAGWEEIEARVHQGTVRDAVLFSVGVNAEHGLRRTNEDKRRAVLRLLADPEWGQWSDREIARQCKVSNRFVSNLRHELSVNGSQMTVNTRLVQRGGTVYEQRVSSEKRAQSKPRPRYVDDPEFDQTGGEWDDAAPAPAPRPSPRPLLPTADRIQQAVVDALQDSGVGLTLAQLHNRVEKRLASRVHEPTLSAIVTKLVSQGALRHEPVTGTYDLARASAERGQGEEQVRRLAEQLEAAICDLLRGGPLTMTEMLWGLREARLDAESALGTAALRVALNQLLKTGQVVRDGPRYELVVEERAAVVLEWALQDVLGKMDALAGALDEMLALSVDDERLQHPAVRQALGRLWEAFPPLRERLTQSEERVETLLRVMGGLA